MAGHSISSAPTVNVPPSGIAWMALTRMFRTTCCTCWLSMQIGGRSGGQFLTIRMCCFCASGRTRASIGSSIPQTSQGAIWGSRRRAKSSRLRSVEFNRAICW